MACITIVPASGDLTPSQPAKRFRNPVRSRRDAPDMVARQAKLTLLAFQLHDTREAALDFLNGHRAEIGGRPLDIAGADEAGLATAIALLRAA